MSSETSELDATELAALTAAAAALADPLEYIGVTANEWFNSDAEQQDTVARVLAATALDAAAKVYADAEEKAVNDLVNQCGFRGINPDPDGGVKLGVKLAARLVANYVQAAEGILGKRGEPGSAVNYSETCVHNPETGERYVITFARADGQTPHELRRQAEQERDAALAEVQRLREQLAGDR